MDTSCLGAGSAITPARGLGGLSHPLPSGQLPIPDFGRVGQDPFLPGVYQEGLGSLGMGASSTPRYRAPTSGGAMRFAGQGPLLRHGHQTPTQPRPWVPAPAVEQAGHLTAMFLARRGGATGGPSGSTPASPAPVPVPTPVVAQAPAPVLVVTPVVPMAPAPTPPAPVAQGGVEGSLSYRRFLEAVLPHLIMPGFNRRGRPFRGRPRRYCGGSRA